MSFNLPTGRLSRRMLGVVSIAVVSMALQTAVSTAQTYPTKPVRMIVPAPAVVTTSPPEPPSRSPKSPESPAR